EDTALACNLHVSTEGAALAKLFFDRRPEVTSQLFAQGKMDAAAGHIDGFDAEEFRGRVVHRGDKTVRVDGDYAGGDVLQHDFHVFSALFQLFVRPHQCLADILGFGSVTLEVARHQVE